MLYELHDLSRRAMRPMAAWAQASAQILRHTPVPGAPFAAAGWELLHRLTKEFPRPHFDLPAVELDGEVLPLSEDVVAATPFCRLVRFVRHPSTSAMEARLAKQQKVLLCAPLSGHFATLLRDTVRALAPDHDVYVTDWIDAKEIPVSAGRFDLSDYVEHLIAFLRELGRDGSDVSMIAVCQPTVPALAAVSLMASRGERTPSSLVLMGGPIDGRRSPTEVNALATKRPLSWFEDHVVHPVPRGYPGVGRRVYPGFLQLTAFVSMNPKRHAKAYRTYWLDRISGQKESAAHHERFYDEYNAVLDMDADYYLETVRLVFQEFALARGTWSVRGEQVVPADIRTTAVFTVEGAEDDITGRGQTHAALELVKNVPADRKRALTAEGCGHYGIFSGRRFRDAIYPELKAFLEEHRVRSVPHLLTATIEEGA